MTATPRPAQRAAVAAALASPYMLIEGPMGTGKTAVGAMILDARVPAGDALLIAPARVLIDAWRGALPEWAPGLWSTCRVENLHTRTPTQRAEVLRARSSTPTLWLATPDTLPALVELGIQHRLTGCLIDEVSFFKAAGSRRVKAMRKLHRHLQWCAGLTGTAVADDWQALYAEMLCIDGGRTLGTRQDAYLDRFFRPAYYQHQRRELREGAEAEIVAAIAPHVHVMPEYRAELPALDLHTHRMDLTPEVARYYRTLAREYVLVDDDGVTHEAATTAVLQGMLRQLCSGVLYLNPTSYIDYCDARVRASVELAANAARGERVILSYELRADRERALDVMPSGVPVTRLSDRYWRDRWRERGGVLIMHPRSGGHGLHLADLCSHLVMISTPWSRDQYDQLIARIWRHGQDSAVTVDEIVMTGTVDELVRDRLADKARFEAEFRRHVEGLGD